MTGIIVYKSLCKRGVTCSSSIDICWHTRLMVAPVSTRPSSYSGASWRDKPQCKPAFQYNLWPTSQARLGLIGSLVPYVTYNLCSACSAEREGQWSPWAKVAMGTTSGCSAPLCAAIAYLKAELSGISLCQASIFSALLPHSLLQVFFSAPSVSSHTQQTVTCRGGCMHACLHTPTHTGQHTHSVYFFFCSIRILKLVKLILDF